MDDAKYKAALVNAGVWVSLGIVIGWFLFSQSPYFVVGACIGSFSTFIALALSAAAVERKPKKTEE